MTVRCARLAMGTAFEFSLVGDDVEHLTAVGEAALDEVTRVERLLSRFDPASEVSRINREAASRPVRVDRELFSILMDCRTWFDSTDGYFDVCATGESDSPSIGRSVRLDPDARTIRFLDPTARLDFGGYGKGYALDAAAQVLDEFGVESAFLHGGTSSILARGRQEDGSPWRIGLHDPFETSLVPTVPRGNAVFDAPRRPEGRGASGEALPRGAWERVEKLDLIDLGVSSSAAFGPGNETSDLIDPIQGRTLDRQSACTVIAPTALEAEVLSTALLAMGKGRASAFLGSIPRVRVAWIERDVVDWLGAGGMP
jgi:FAD:protein FMN transferase